MSQADVAPRFTHTQYADDVIIVDHSLEGQQSIARDLAKMAEQKSSRNCDRTIGTCAQQDHTTQRKTRLMGCDLTAQEDMHIFGSVLSRRPQAGTHACTCKHTDLPALGGPHFGSVRAHVAAASLCAAVSAFLGCPEVGAILRRAHAHVATLEEFGREVWWPSWWDTRPIAAHLEDAQRALRWDPLAHGPTSNRYEEIFQSRRPQAACWRLREQPRPRVPRAGMVTTDEQRWIEMARIVENVGGQVQALADAGGREAQRVGGLEQSTRSLQETFQGLYNRQGAGGRVPTDTRI